MAYLTQADMTASNPFWQNEFEDLSCIHIPSFPSDSYIPSITETIEHVLNDVPAHQARSDLATSTVLRFAWASVISTCLDAEHVVFGVVVTSHCLPVPGILDMTGPTIATMPLRVQKKDSQLP
ncbi:hypothetical protein P170DRAFT_476752 [Aspergillus steynii IBT 23096]|uniref:Condensation domain-containing protein n=1 Tax=Aspergillus steynii IBT 23096 TaxID=1392250 RepID=A0A2I2G5F6_9EURO|nr:uncharacterized protein P170DRAFT_476752 [Aspergillus steynii IBT 23096]PLB48107.1 hypothetical protein P170DRAFT_476752 [Aspergillus steynii IBT 23096]